MYKTDREAIFIKTKQCTPLKSFLQLNLVETTQFTLLLLRKLHVTSGSHVMSCFTVWHNLYWLSALKDEVMNYYLSKPFKRLSRQHIFLLSYHSETVVQDIHQQNSYLASLSLGVMIFTVYMVGIRSDNCLPTVIHDQSESYIHRCTCIGMSLLGCLTQVWVWIQAHVSKRKTNWNL